MNERISIDRLRDALSYDPDTSVMRWRIQAGNRNAGDLAGSPDAKGYVKVKIDGGLYWIHVLAWAHFHGRWPEDQVDHRDLDNRNNRIGNLREATNAQNCANQGIPKSNTTGFNGVTRRSNGRFSAGIRVDYRRINLGTRDTAEAASELYQAAARKYFGDYARTQ